MLDLHFEGLSSVIFALGVTNGIALVAGIGIGRVYQIFRDMRAD